MRFRWSNKFKLLTNSSFRKKYLLAKFNIRYAPELLPFPPMVLIDTTTRCNLACNHCPSSILSKDSSWVGDMDVELYRKIVDEIALENPDTIVRPFDGGEPLMRKDLEQLIKYAKDKGIKFVSINTNGTLLNKKRALKIISSGLDHIEFSVDAFSEESYEEIKNQKSYSRVVENIERLINLKNQIRPDFKISVSFVKQRANIHEAENFHDYWHGRVEKVNFREYHQHGSLVDEHGKYQEKNRKYRHPCPYLWNRIIVQHDGAVRFCENDWKAEFAIGNVRHQTLREIWLSEKYQELRNSHVKGKFEHLYCHKCPDWKVIA